MKKILVTIIVFFCLLSAQAQVKIGIRLGGNSARFNNFYFPYDITYGSDGPKSTVLVTPIVSFQAGLVIDVPLSDEFSFQPGILFSKKGTKFEALEIDDNSSTDLVYYYEEKSIIRASYIEVPLNFLLKTDLGAARLLVGAGPYFGYGISGNTSFTSNYRSFNKTSKLQVNSDSNDGGGSIAWSESDLDNKNTSNPDDFNLYLNRLDLGINFNLGIELRERIQLGVNYGLGLKNVFPDYYEVTSAKNRVLSLTATYLFGN